MNNSVLKILRKIYTGTNRFYHSRYKRHEFKIPNTVTTKEKHILNSLGFRPNTFETYEHDYSLGQLLRIRGNNKLTLDFVSMMFLQGLTGELPRGRQPLISYSYLKHLPDHQFTGKDICTICGLPKNGVIDRTFTLYKYYSGYSGNRNPLDFLIDLEELLSYEKKESNGYEKRKLVELLRQIKQASPTELPLTLEKRIAKNNFLFRTNGEKRIGLLQGLAECGVLPNKIIQPRFDVFTTQDEIMARGRKFHPIELPLAAWKGENGVNFTRYVEIFGKMLP